MSAAESSGTNGGETEVWAEALAQHPAWVLALMATVPRWVAELGKDPGLVVEVHRFLDRAVAAGWCETEAEPGFLGGSLTLELPPMGSGTTTSSDYGAHRETVEHALASGVITVRPEVRTELREEPSPGRQAVLAMSTVLVRSVGFRFKAGEQWVVGGRGTAWMRWKTAPSRGGRSGTMREEELRLGFEVLECAGSEWSGYEVGCGFERRSEGPDARREVGRRVASVAWVRREVRGRLLTHAVGAMGWSDRGWWSLAKEVDGLFRSDVTWPEDLSRWREFSGRILTEGGDFAGSLRWLDERIRSRIEAGAESEALGWMRMAEAFLGAMGKPLEMVLELNERRLELAYRREVEERYLRSFLERREQLEAFRELMAGEGERPWALHYLGVGGVGKTMLLRHLLYRELRDVPSARVDFDYLKPEYPAVRPGQLLLELADGLRIFSRGRSDEFFEKFRMEAESFHLQLEQRQRSEDPLAALRDDRFGFLLTLFAEFVGQFGASRVVLILDTCEELARLRPEGGFLPAVEATFEILEQVHRRCPFVRVVLAGRRLLGDAGAGWEATGGEAPRSARPHLALHLIRGFDREEALRFLGMPKRPPAEGERGPIEGELAEAILAKSPEEAPQMAIRWEGRGGERKEARYNPFELSMLADWYVDDAQVTAAMIRDAKEDPYVEHRILGRLRQPRVLRALPYLVLLPQIERVTLKSVLEELEDEEFDALFRELCRLEWVMYRAEDGGEERYLRVQDGLRARLGRCLRAGRWEPELRRARRRLRPLLLPALLQPMGIRVPEEGLAGVDVGVVGEGLGRMDLEQLEATLRLLPEAEGLELWLWLEEAFAAGGRWDLALEATRRLAEVREPLSPWVTAAVCATRAAATGHVDPGALTPGLWRGARPEGLGGVGSARARWLWERAELGELAALARSGISSEGGVFVRLAEVLKTNPFEGGEMAASVGTRGASGASGAGESGEKRLNQVMASRVAAMEAVLELASSSPGFAGMLSELPRQEFVPRERLEPDIRWALEIAELRWVAWSTQVRNGEATVPEAVPEVPGDLAGRSGWYDWVPPVELAVRLRLEVMRWPGNGARRRALRRLADQWLGETVEMWADEETLGLSSEEERLRGPAVRRFDTDLERLVAACLQLRLGDEVVPVGELKRLESVVGDGFRAVRCAAHRATPPLFVVVARGWLAAGYPEEAMRLLRRGEGGQTQIKDAVDWTHRTILEVVRRMRWRGQAEEIARYRAMTGVAEDEAVAWPVLRLVPGSAARPEVDPGTLTPERVVAWWLTQPSIASGGQDLPLESWLESCRHLPDRSPLRAEILLVVSETVREKEMERWGVIRLLEAELDRGRDREEVVGWKVGLIEFFLSSSVRLVETETEALGHTFAGARSAGGLEQMGRIVRATAAEGRASVLRRMAAPGMRQLPSLGEVVGRGGAREVGIYALEMGELLVLRRAPMARQWLGLAARLFELAGDSMFWFLAVRLMERAGVGESGGAHVAASVGATLGELWARLGRRGEVGVVPGVANREGPWAFWSETGHGAEVDAVMPAAPAEPEPGSAPGGSGRDGSGREVDGLAKRPVGVPLLGLVWGTVSVLVGWGMWLAVGLVVLVPVLGLLGALGFLGEGRDWITVGILVFAAVAMLFVDGAGDIRIGSVIAAGVVGIVGVVGVVLRLRRKRIGEALRQSLFLSIRAIPTMDEGKAGGRRARYRVVGTLRCSGLGSETQDRSSAGGTAPMETLGVTYLGRAVWERAAEPGGGLAEERAPGWLLRLRPRWLGWLGIAERAVGLEVENVGGVPWERDVVRGYLGTGEPAGAAPVVLGWRVPFELYRWRPYGRGIAKESSMEGRGRVFLVTSPGHKALATTAWEASGLRSMFVADEWRDLEVGTEWPLQVRVVHWMGRPLRTPAGVVLKVESRAEWQRTGERKAPASKLSVGPFEELLITPGKAGLDQVPLLVVEGPPAEIVELGASDWNEHWGLREFCARLFEGGAMAVLMIPGLPGAVGEVVRAELARGVAKAKRMDLAALLDMTRRLRRAVATWGPGAGGVQPGSGYGVPTPEALVELSVAITLFARHDHRQLPPLP